MKYIFKSVLLLCFTALILTSSEANEHPELQGKFIQTEDIREIIF